MYHIIPILGCTRCTWTIDFNFEEMTKFLGCTRGTRATHVNFGDITVYYLINHCYQLIPASITSCSLNQNRQRLLCGFSNLFYQRNILTCWCIWTLVFTSVCRLIIVAVGIMSDLLRLRGRNGSTNDDDDTDDRGDGSSNLVSANGDNGIWWGP